MAFVSSALSGQTIIPITNAGFETGTTTVADGWSNQIASTGATFNRVSGTAGNEVHSGSYAMQILSPAINTTQARIQQTNAARFAVTVGETYTISFWAKGTDLDLARDRIRVSVEWWNAAGTGVVATTNGSLLSLSSNDTWQQYGVGLTATAPANAATAKILIFFDRSASSTSTSPVITFDDIAVTAASSIPEPSSVALVLGAVVVAVGGGVRRRCR